LKATPIFVLLFVAISPLVARADECAYLVSGLKSLDAEIDPSRSDNVFYVTLGRAYRAFAMCYRPFVRVSFEFESKAPTPAFFRDASAVAAAIDGGSSDEIHDLMASCAGIAAARPTVEHVKLPFSRGLVECTVLKEDRGLSQFDVSVRKRGAEYDF
jgi:hypothetical protein